MRVHSSAWVTVGIIILLLATLSTAGCLSDDDLDSLWNDCMQSISPHRASLDNYLLVYTIGIDLWNIELAGDAPNPRTLRTQIAREEAFLTDLSEKHWELTGAVSRFSDYAGTLEGNRGEWAVGVAWDLRLYDEEMWNVQNAFKGRLAALSQYLDLADTGRGDTAEAYSYLESANSLSADAGASIARADAARARAESQYADAPFPKIHLL